MAAVKKALFIHQNFPGQFMHLAPALVDKGWEVLALGIKGRGARGVKFFRYAPAPLSRASDIAEGRDFEVKLARGKACLAAMLKLKAAGFEPAFVFAHPGWGEALFCKDVWPSAKLVVFAEFFYSAEGSDYGFDPEFAKNTMQGRVRLRLMNTVHLHAFSAADRIYTPTQWQKSRLPVEYQARTSVVFDGIDTARARPDPSASFELKRQGITVRAGDEVLTFVNRNLEPYRGFHIFMRALPEILARRPNARCIIVGRDGVSYGARPPGGGSWRDALMKEVGHRLPMDRVHFLGGLKYEDYLRVLQASACHVYMTYPFVLSWSCMEAMSVGCAVLASDTAPVREVITQGRNGELFDFFDTSALVERATALLADSGRKQRLGKAARESVVRSYDLQAVCLPQQLALLGA